MKEKIPNNPILFGLYISKIHKKWAMLALLFVFIATAISRSTVLVLSNLTDAIAATPLSMNAIWLWAIIYPLIFI